MILRAQQPGEELGNFPQQFIARGVAAGVIDDLEVIQIQVTHHMVLVFHAGMGKRLRQGLLKGASVA